MQTAIVRGRVVSLIPRRRVTLKDRAEITGLIASWFWTLLAKASGGGSRAVHEADANRRVWAAGVSCTRAAKRARSIATAVTRCCRRVLTVPA